MDLTGTLSNREVALETLEPTEVKARILVSAPPHAKAPAPPGQRAGRIKRSVIQALECSGVPQRVAEIRRECEKQLGVPVNRSTISDYLIKHSIGEARLFDRTERGSYVWRRA